MHTTIVTIPAMIASFILVSFLVFYALYLVYVYLNIISFVSIISLNDNLTNLNSSVTTLSSFKQASLSANTSVINSGYTYGGTCWKFGQTVLIIAHFEAAYFTSGKTLFTVPSGYRPSSTKNGIIICSRRPANTAYGIYQISVNSSGSLYQSFNSEGTSSSWTGTGYIMYTT